MTDQTKGVSRNNFIKAARQYAKAYLRKNSNPNPKQQRLLRIAATTLARDAAQLQPSAQSPSLPHPQPPTSPFPAVMHAAHQYRINPTPQSFRALTDQVVSWFITDQMPAQHPSRREVDHAPNPHRHSTD